MNQHEAIKILASRIWKNGELVDGCGCLIPTWYAKGSSPFNEASDILNKVYKATHYSRLWEREGKTIKIEIWKNDGFGAASGGCIVHTEIIDVEK